MNQTQLLWALLLFVVTVSFAGVTSYSLVRWVERRYPMFAIVVGAIGVFLVLFLLTLVFTHYIWRVLFIVLVTFSGLGGIAHRSSGGSSKGGLEAWVLAVVAAELTLFITMFFSSFITLPLSPTTSRKLDMLIRYNLSIFTMIVGSACFISPNAAVLFLRAYQVLKLRPGIDGHLNSDDEPM